MSKFFSKVLSRKLYIYLFLFVVTLVAYAPALRGPFFFDDNIFIEHNVSVQNFDLKQIYTSSTTAGSGLSGDNFYRPNGQAIFALLTWLFGLSPLISHFVKQGLLDIAAKSVADQKIVGQDKEEIEQYQKDKNFAQLAKKLGVEIKDYMTDGEILLEIFEKKCTDQLIQPTFVYDYPADFYPLAKRKKDNPKLVESFDIYVAGMEMGTNWSEQNDPAVLQEAWNEEKKKAKKGNQEAQKTDDDFLEALEYGMPPTSGIGPGIDRWVMVLTNSPAIADVIAFPMLRPEKRKK